MNNNIFQRSIVALLVLFWLHQNASGFPKSHGPFQPGHEPASIPCNKCELVTGKSSPSDDIEGVIRCYRAPADSKGRDQTTITLRGTTNGWLVVACDAQGKSLMALPATNSMDNSLVEVFSCDLNRDGLSDFIVNVWSGGVGLAAESSEVTLVLSSKKGYRATSFFMYSFGTEDLVQFKAGGPVYFIFNDLIGNGGEKTRDGRDHNFWVYELYRVDDVRFIPTEGQAGFPKWVLYTNKDNHEETNQLSKEQKARLMKKTRAER